MNFIQAKNERLYAVDRIVSIGPDETRAGEWVRDLEIEGAGIVTFFGFRVEELLRQPVTLIPAQPETYVIHLSEDEVGGYGKYLVLGWATSRDSNLYPVTAEGVNHGLAQILYVLTPDGRVSHSESGSWDSLDAFLGCEKHDLTDVAG